MPRTDNITKSEWVLNGETVLYASADSIRDTLDYDFGLEKEFSYEGLSADEAIKHITRCNSKCNGKRLKVQKLHFGGTGNSKRVTEESFDNAERIGRDNWKIGKNDKDANS